VDADLLRGGSLERISDDEAENINAGGSEEAEQIESTEKQPRERAATRNRELENFSAVGRQKEINQAIVI